MIRLLILCCLLASIACGPSLKHAHENTQYYERCYAADHNPSVSSDTRRECWSRWLEAHSSNQPPERITFAEQRLQQLAADGSTRPLPDQEPEPVPELEHEYPPAPPGEYHTSGCNPLCNERWHACTSHCEQKHNTCKDACRTEYRVCLEGCP
ncbi:MAG: hypothetical protein OEM15_14220 [Myxococcales bacterium]|nr:hypothetical protein [Myxococcales bacterium]MDH3484589.1 hypothetical protein [Myxococcales bacterium]